MHGIPKNNYSPKTYKRFGLNTFSNSTEDQEGSWWLSNLELANISKATIHSYLYIICYFVIPYLLYQILNM